MKFSILQAAFFTLMLSSFAVIVSCKNSPSSSNTVHSVNPFDTTQMESQVLSEADRLKLASASGKSNTVISEDALANRILQSTDKLYVYCFWNMENDMSLSTMKALQHVSNNFDTTELKIVFINFKEIKSKDEVTLLIRENQISDETLLLENSDWSFFKNKLKKELEDVKDLPIILLVNKSEEIFQLYNKPMDEKELTALLQPYL
jgi:hypothetical protein